MSTTCIKNGRNKIEQDGYTTRVKPPALCLKPQARVHTLHDMRKRISKYALVSLLVYSSMLFISPNLAAGINEPGYQFSSFAEYVSFYWLFAFAGSLNDIWPWLVWALFAGGIFYEIKKGFLWKGSKLSLKDHVITHLSMLGITTLPTILFSLHVISYVGP